MEIISCLLMSRIVKARCVRYELNFIHFKSIHCGPGILSCGNESDIILSGSSKCNKGEERISR